MLMRGVTMTTWGDYAREAARQDKLLDDTERFIATLRTVLWLWAARKRYETPQWPYGPCPECQPDLFIWPDDGGPCKLR